MAKILINTRARRTGTDKFQGFWISEKIADMLTLYCLVNSFSKSKLIRGIVIKWISENGLNESRMIKDLCNKIQIIWNERKQNINSSSIDLLYNNFTTTLIGELKQNNLTEDKINTIIKHLKK